MLNTRRLFLAAVLCIPSILSANICDDIHTQANRWHKLANAIDNRGHDNLSPAERKRVSAEDRKQIPPSRELVNLCKSDKLRRVQSLGKQLSALLEEYASLNDDDGWDEDVKIIDKIVAVMDELTDVCDANH